MIDKNFVAIDFSKENLPKEEYEECTFINCNFSSADIYNCTIKNNEVLVNGTIETRVRNKLVKGTEIAVGDYLITIV